MLPQPLQKPPEADATGGVVPVAPPEVAVAPVGVAPPSNVVPIKQGGLTVKTATVNDADVFESAVDSGDTKALYSLTTSFDPRVSEAAKDKVAVIEKNAPLAQALTSIDTNTAQGRMEIAQVYQTLNNRDEARAKGWTTIQDNPQVGTALLRFVMGDKIGALNQITGGAVKAETEYDDAGKMLIVNRNELGQIDSIFDPDGKMISRQEYAARGGSRDLDKTLARKKQLLELETNTKTYLETTGKQNKAVAALGAASTYSRDMAELSKDFVDLDPETSAMLASFNNSTLNYENNRSNTIGLLDSLARSKTKDLSAGQIKDIITGVGNITGQVIKHEEGDKFSVGGKTGVSVNDLLQQTKQSSTSAGIERSVNQSKENVANQIRIVQASKLDPNQKEAQIRRLQKMDRYFDLAGQREKIYAENKENLPAFAQIPTSLPNITDQASRLKLNAIQGEYAAAQVSAFNDWKSEELKKERAVNPNFVPEPGRYEAQWVKQSEFKRLEKEFRDQARGILNEMPKVGPKVETGELAVGPVSAPQATQNEPAANKAAVPPSERSKLFSFPEDDKKSNKPKAKIRRVK
jgi:hypothetical protein